MCSDPYPNNMEELDLKLVDFTVVCSRKISRACLNSFLKDQINFSIEVSFRRMWKLAELTGTQKLLRNQDDKGPSVTVCLSQRQY